MDNEAAQEQQAEAVAQALREKLQRGVAFEEFIRTKGFEFIKAYYENSIRAFSNKALREGFKDQEEYQFERGKIVGLSTVFNEINSCIATLTEERDKSKPKAKEKNA